MARIRITRELLEHLLDLPEGIVITGLGPQEEMADGVEVVSFYVEAKAHHKDFEYMNESDATYALQYEETEHGTSLVSAIPVPE